MGAGSDLQLSKVLVYGLFTILLLALAVFGRKRQIERWEGSGPGNKGATNERRRIQSFRWEIRSVFGTVWRTQATGKWTVLDFVDGCNL